MRLLITGGAGFIGTNFVRWILESGECPVEVERVVVVDSLTYAGNLGNLEGLEKRDDYVFYKNDIRDSDAIKKILNTEKIDILVNFAAESHVDRSIVSPLDFVRTNVEGTQVLLNCARDTGVSRYVQISTDEVYGSLGPTGRFTEDSPIDPSSAYSASKTAGDLLALATAKTYGYDVCVTRCSNNYGPYQFPEKLIPLFVTNALNDQPLPLYGDGKNVRSWLHVDDHSRAIMAVISKGRAGEVYNIGGAPESEKENIEVTQKILSILGKPETLVKHVEDRLGHDRRYAVDYSKINSELGWEPQVTFEEGIQDCIRWYRENVSWWSAIKSGEYLKFYQHYYGDRLETAV
jgi:dTDP-glucose 4,6-dehydratase